MAEQIGAVAHKIVDRWAWWRAALKNPASIGKSLPVHESEPQQGYYRVKNKDTGGWEPVALFYPEDSDEMVAFRAGKEVRGGPERIWTWCCRYPVEYGAYMAACAGGTWLDDDEVVAEQVAAKTAEIGDNSGAVDPAEALMDQIGAALKGVEAYDVIKDDLTQAKAQSLRNRLNELAKDADKQRDELKRPHLEAGKQIDKTWMPLVKLAKEGADQIRAAMAAWETQKLQEERKRLAEENAARARAMSAHTPETPPPAAPASIKGTYGKAASVSVKTVVKAVSDWEVLAVCMCGHPEMRDLLFKLAQRAVDAGKTVPGIITEEEAKVR